MEGYADLIKQPASPACVKYLQTLADDNMRFYSRAAYFIPKNGSDERAASIWANWRYPKDATTKIRQAGREDEIPVSYGGEIGEKPLPFQDEFWSPAHRSTRRLKVSELVDIRGYIISLPHLWTRYENNDTRVNTMITASLDVPGRSQG